MSDNPSSAVIIALDAMGGDTGPGVVVPAAALALQNFSFTVRYQFYGDEAQVRPLLEKHPALAAISEIIHTDKKVASDEKPSSALRNAKGTSMKMAIDAVAEGRAQGIVSAGNTGALMAIAKLALRTLPGIERPALASIMPGRAKDCVMLDLGANVTCDEHVLVQFAVLGSVYARAVRNVENPTVGLLNVGTEDMKGTDEVRAAAAILAKLKFPGTFTGFVEGNDISRGTVDVVVTDGFTGNIALKVTEGVASLVAGFFKDALKSTPLSMLGAFLARGALNRMKRRADPRFYNGGMFLGLNGICVKSHGGMDEVGFANAITVAANLIRNGYNSRVADEIAAIMAQGEIAHGAPRVAATVAAPSAVGDA